MRNLLDVSQLWISDKLPILREGRDYHLLAKKAGYAASIPVEVGHRVSRPPTYPQLTTTQGNLAFDPPTASSETVRTVILAPIPSLKVQWTRNLVAQLVKKAVPLPAPASSKSGSRSSGGGGAGAKRGSGGAGEGRPTSRSENKLSFVLPDVSDWELLKDELVAAGPFKTDRIWERSLVKSRKVDEHVEYSSCLTCCRSREPAPVVALSLGAGNSTTNTQSGTTNQKAPTSQAHRSAGNSSSSTEPNNSTGNPSMDSIRHMSRLTMGGNNEQSSEHQSPSSSFSTLSTFETNSSPAKLTTPLKLPSHSPSHPSSLRQAESRSETQEAPEPSDRGGSGVRKSARCTCRTRIAAKVRSDRRGVQVTITDRLAVCTAPTDRKERAMVSKFVHQLASLRVPPPQMANLLASLTQPQMEPQSIIDPFFADSADVGGSSAVESTRIAQSAWKAMGSQHGLAASSADTGTGMGSGGTMALTEAGAGATSQIKCEEEAEPAPLMSPQDKEYYYEWLSSGKYCQVLRATSARHHRMS